MRPVLSFVATLALLMPLVGAPERAEAFGFQVVELAGCNPIDPVYGCFGETIKIGLRFENDAGLEIQSIVARVSSSSGPVDISGDFVERLLYDFCAPGLGCAGGLFNNPLQLGPVPPNDYVFISAIDFVPHSSDGSGDAGLDGVAFGGDAQFRFDVTTWVLGSTILTFRIDFLTAASPYDPALLDEAEVQIAIYSDLDPPEVLVPEPQVAAMIPAGGLALLALKLASRRRDQRH